MRKQKSPVFRPGFFLSPFLSFLRGPASFQMMNEHFPPFLRFFPHLRPSFPSVMVLHVACPHFPLKCSTMILLPGAALVLRFISFLSAKYTPYISGSSGNSIAPFFTIFAARRSFSPSSHTRPVCIFFSPFLFSALVRVIILSCFMLSFRICRSSFLDTILPPPARRINTHSCARMRQV